MVVIKKGKIICAFCGGKGVLARKQSMDIKCPACQGRGYALFARAIICPYCKGRGRRTANLDMTCQVCKGLGAFEVRGGFKICPDCKGKGVRPGQFLPCTTCRGKGII